jgi:hypothetical protein
MALAADVLDFAPPQGCTDRSPLDKALKAA